MSFERVRKIPSAKDVLKRVPLPSELKQVKRARDAELKKIITGESDKFLLVIGPCSADEEDSVCDYVSRLAKVNDKVRDVLHIVPRIYTNKPRTTGEGYKGMLHQPNPDEDDNMLNGVLSIRRMHVRAMCESGLTAADEMLYTDNLIYCEDLLSYIAVGARSVEDQQHRLTASGIDMPVGMKNPTSGDFNVMFNSIQAAQASHSFIYQGFEVKTSGNPLTHAILRGSVTKHGENVPNYHYEDLSLAMGMYAKRGFENPMIVVDVNHSNSGKLFYEQPRITKEIIHSRRYSDSLRRIVRGLMIESYIEEGCQKVGEGVYGKSITDPCLGWAETERLIYFIAENV
ncbi:MAG: 3-deoxy-7-phosphoheptulonate synthase [Clostridiales bacterium]|nr:3-deoxy-7-phosphoheptulonate synthase [Clostridiales bacterium]